MRDRTRDPVGDHSKSDDPQPFLRGRRQIITVIRIPSLLAHLGLRHARNRRITSDATRSVAQVWRLLHPTRTSHDPFNTYRLTHGYWAFSLKSGNLCVNFHQHMSR